MERQKEANSIGLIYFVLLIGNILICLAWKGLKMMGVNISSVPITLLCELFILGPVLIYIRSKNESITESLGLHKIKFTTVLLTVLLTITVTPIYFFVNALSQLFVSNTLIQNTGDMIDGSIAGTIIVTSVVAPLFEEIAFRGFFYNKIRDRSSVLKAAIISALLFGIMHLNVNQFCYAVVLGFVFALVNQASGSTWTSVIMHFLINFVNVILVIIATLALREQDVDIAQLQEAARTEPGVIMTQVYIYGAISIICVVFVWLLIKAIAKNQGNLDRFKAEVSGKKSSDSEIFGRVHSVRNVPMMASILIGIVAIIVFELSGVLA